MLKDIFIRIGKCKAGEYICIHLLFNSNHNLNPVNEDKSLWEIIDDKLSFEEHINELKNRANKMVDLIRMSFKD